MPTFHILDGNVNKWVEFMIADKDSTKSKPRGISLLLPSPDIPYHAERYMWGTSSSFHTEIKKIGKSGLELGNKEERRNRKAAKKAKLRRQCNWSPWCWVLTVTPFDHKNHPQPHRKKFIYSGWSDGCTKKRK